MKTVMQKSRQTKYCTQIGDILANLEHASNAEILIALQLAYPEVSATTVHRATARLAARGELGIAPPDSSGAMRYDTNVTAHDHFMCSRCGVLRDVDIAEQVRPLIEKSIEGCSVSGRMTISGLCKQCSKGEL